MSLAITNILRDLIYKHTHKKHKGRNALGRRHIVYTDNNGTHVVARLRQLDKKQLISRYHILQKNGLLQNIPEIDHWSSID